MWNLVILLSCTAVFSLGANLGSPHELDQTLLQVATKDTEGPLCGVCKFAMDELDKILQQNSTETEIENALENVCSKLPDTIAQECTAFVQTYYPEIISLLVQHIDPKDICTKLGLCQTGNIQTARTAPLGCPWEDDCSWLKCSTGSYQFCDTTDSFGVCYCKK